MSGRFSVILGGYGVSGDWVTFTQGWGGKLFLAEQIGLEMRFGWAAVEINLLSHSLEMNWSVYVVVY